MRISDWSSDVCSSDLFLASFLPRELFGKMMRRLFPDRTLAATDPDVVKHGAASGHDSDDVGEHGARPGPNGLPPAIKPTCEYYSTTHPAHHPPAVTCDQAGKHLRKGHTFGSRAAARGADRTASRQPKNLLANIPRTGIRHTISRALHVSRRVSTGGKGDPLVPVTRRAISGTPRSRIAA